MDDRYIPKHPFLAGALTGGVEILITFPLEFIKVQLQLKHHYHLNQFHGPMSCALYTINNKGFLGLYRGLSSLLYFSFPRSAVRFSTYEHVGHWLQDDGKKLDPLNAMMAGTVAGAMEWVTVGTPMLCIQIKMAHDSYSATPHFRGFAHATYSIIKEEGVWRGLFGGLGPTVLKGAVNNCIRFSCFNELKHLYGMTKDTAELRAGGGEVPLEPLESMLLGGLSGGLSAIFTHPIDTIKTNMQSLGGGGYRNSWDCLRSIYQHQGGLRALYKGLLPRFIRVCLEIGLHFTLFDIFSRQLDQLG